MDVTLADMDVLFYFQHIDVTYSDIRVLFCPCLVCGASQRVLVIRHMDVSQSDMGV